MPTRLRRTIYIGAGGTGVETVLQVRDYFKSLTKDGSLPPMIKCLFVDTDENLVQNLDSSVTDAEILSLAERNAKPIYKANQDKYALYPNMATIRALTNGAGQYRSHGRFAIMSKENTNGNVQNPFSQKFLQIYNDIMRIDAGVSNPDFVTMGKDVEIHIAFSMSGGTGAGTFLALAYLIREIVPACKIVAYAYSASFFMDLPTKEQIQQNSYASLIELDYCMSSDHAEFQDVKYPGAKTINRAPFDAVMYIDNKTYSRNGAARPYVYPTTAKDQVQKNVAYAMAISAGAMGAATRSVFDNLISDITGGQYDVVFSDTKELKRGWISSLGVSEISCEQSAEQSFFANNLAIRILKALIDGGRTIDSASEEAFSWVKELDLNESGDTADQDAVINSIVSPSEFKNKIAKEVDRNNVDSGLSMYLARVEKPIAEEVLIDRKNHLLSQKKQNLLNKVQNVLFAAGNNAISLMNTIDIIRQFGAYMDEYAAVLGEEKRDFEEKLESNSKSWKETSSAIKAVGGFNKGAKIATFESELRSLAQKRFEYESNIHRREKAIGFFEEMRVYANAIEKALSTLLSKVNNAKNAEERKKTAVNTMPIYSANRWGTIDLTRKAKELPSTNASETSLDLSRLFRATHYTSIFDLADCDDIDGLVEKYAMHLFEENEAESNDLGSSLYPIVRVLKSLSDEERNEYLSKASMYSFPLMDVENYGEDVKITEHIYIAVPGGDECDPDIKQWIADSLNSNVVPDWVNINDPNRILIYRQIGVVPPYFISGISRGRNSVYFHASCQDAFESKDDPRSYVPFTDKQFDDIYHKKGYSLESNKRRDGSVELLTWIQAIILGLVTKTEEGQYKVESETGEVDILDPEFRKMRLLGDNRVDAFMAFRNDNELYDEISLKVSSILEDPVKQTKWQGYRGANRSQYGKEFINKTDAEWKLPEVQKQYQKEMSIL